MAATTNGDWIEMRKLILSKMDEHSAKLDKLCLDVASINTQIAVINDRGDREMTAARTVATKWGAALGALVAALVSGVIGLWRNN